MGNKWCQSPLESKLYNEFKSVGLIPKIQYPIDIFFADFAFPEKKIVIEVDGMVAHQNRKSNDNYRDQKLLSLGWKTIRFPGWFVFRYPDACVAEIILRHFPETEKKKPLKALMRYFFKSSQEEMGNKILNSLLSQ